MRETKSVYYVDEENIYFFEEFVRKYIDEKEFDHQDSYKKVYSSGVNDYIEENSWVYSLELGIH